MKAGSCDGIRPDRAARNAARMALVLLTLVAMLAPASVGHADATGYLQVSAGVYHTCALKLDRTVVCWGGNGYGQATPPGGTFLQISAGGYHTCGVRDNGAVECWGHEGAGQSGYHGGPYLQVAAGLYHTCAIRGSDRTVACWGAGTTNWEENHEFGQSMPPADVDFADVSAGDKHTCGVEVDGNIQCWGDNVWMKLVSPFDLDFGQISAGGEHSCAVDLGGDAACWGMNLYGQLKVPENTTFSQVTAGGYHSCGLKTDGTLACWGYNLYGQVKNTPTTGTYKQVEAGQGHVCAIRSDDQIVCWGRNDHKQSTPPAPGGPGVQFDFEGFYPPVQADPALNVVKAGSSVPLKFSLGGDQGLQILAAGSPASAPLDCATLDPGDDYQPAKSPSSSGLGYDAASAQYTYVWKTEKAWAGTCRVLSLRLTDETEHRVAFQFR
jgi:hypothetical protein